MKKIQKLLILIMAAAMLTTSCSKSNNDSSKPEGSSSSQAVSSEESKEEEKDNLGEFSTKTLAGEDISNAVFADYDLTMINIWATWCGACINEMPELAKLYKEVEQKDNINMMAICTDIDGQEEVVEKYLAEIGAEFPVVIAEENLQAYLNSRIEYLPTTIFVDKDGNVVGDYVIGVPKGETVVDAYMGEFEKRLDMLK